MNIRRLLEGKTITECYGLISPQGVESGFEMTLNNRDVITVEGDFQVNVVTNDKVGTIEPDLICPYCGTNHNVTVMQVLDNQIKQAYCGHCVSYFNQEVVKR